MEVFYSAQTGGFYPGSDRQFYESVSLWPPDAVAIEHAEYLALLADQASGRQIVPGADGRPTTVAGPVGDV